MRTMLLAAAAAFAVLGMAPRDAPGRFASEATGTETSYRTARWDRFDANDRTRAADAGDREAEAGANATRTGPDYRTAQAEQTGVNGSRLG